jgi:hypothetical protein
MPGLGIKAFGKHSCFASASAVERGQSQGQMLDKGLLFGCGHFVAPMFNNCDMTV